MTLSAATGSLRSLAFWLCCLGALAFGGAFSSAAEKWPEVNKAELAETTPKIDKEAGAEILLREVFCDYSAQEGSEERYYIRAKIFSERGLKHFSLVKIHYYKGSTVTNIVARTIKPDGTIVELKPEEVRSRDVYKDSENIKRTKTFAFPGLEIGSIVEFRYTILASEFTVIGTTLIFQTDLPSRLVRYKVALAKLPAILAVNYDLRAITFNCPNQKLIPKDGVVKFEFSNLPAAKDEPYAPPEIATRAAMILYFTTAKDLPPLEFWQRHSKELYKKYQTALKTSPQITAALAQIIAETDSEAVKLHKIYDWCRTKITNRERDTTRLTAEERKALKSNETATDVLKNNAGNSVDINLLFTALARAAGFDARVAVCNNRLRYLFNENITEPNLMMPDLVTAVQLGGQWRYSDPGYAYLPFAQLRSRNTDTAILISDAQGLERPTVVPGDPAEHNCIQRKAELRISANGTLEGDVAEVYSGLEDANLKNNLDDKSPEKREEFFRTRLRRQFKQARITNVLVENAADPLTKTKVTYHIKIPSYAEKTGTRLFFQPAVFQKGDNSLLNLPIGERKNSLIFPFRFEHKDEVEIALPAGYILEAASAPVSFTANGFGDYDVHINLNRVTQVLSYKRDISLTDIKFNKSTYTDIKGVLDKIRQRDDHTLTLKRDESVPIPEEAPEPKEPSEETDSKSTNSEDNKSGIDLAP